MFPPPVPPSMHTKPMRDCSRQSTCGPMLAHHHTSAGKAVCVLVSLGATVAWLCALFVTAFGLCVWALGRGEAETPAYVLTACHVGTPGCVLAALWHLKDVLACLFAVSFCLFFVVLMLHCG